MTNEEKILEMLTGMQNDIKKINSRLDSMEAKVDRLETKVDSLETKLDDLAEAHEETRTSVNLLVDWAERASNAYDLPLPKLG